MSYNIVYNIYISCFPSPAPGQVTPQVLLAAAHLGQSVVAAGVPPYAGVLRCPALFAAMEAQNAPMYPCMC